MEILSGRFCGTQLAKRHAAGLHLVESVHQPNDALPWHTHRWPYFTFVLRGSYTEQCAHGSFDLVEGDVVLHHAGEAHADQIHHAQSCLLNLELTQPWLDRLAACGAAFDSRVTCSTSELVYLGRRLQRELWSDQRVSDLCIEAIALEVIAHFVQRTPGAGSPPRWLDTAKDYLRAHFNTCVTLADVAAAAGVHPVHLAREFRRKQGATIGEYLRRLRVDFVRDALLVTDDSIVDIAVIAGFSDHSHMTRVFRRATGVTPTEFRRRGRR